MKLISFESTSEGAGKTTQIDLLMQELESRSIPAIRVKFPDGDFRQIILSGNLSAKSHMLLQHAEFSHKIDTIIKPAIDQNKWVILDRWIDSSYAYQGFASGIDLGDINRSLEFAIGMYKPLVTILLDLDASLALARIKAREEPVRIAQAKGHEFSDRVRLGFLSLAHQFSHRIKLVDANGSPQEVFSRVRALLPCFNQNGN